MKRIILLIIPLIPALAFSSFFHPYFGYFRGLSGSFESSIDFTMNELVGFGYTMGAELGYSGFLGEWAVDLSGGIYKIGSSIYRFEDGKIVEYRFEGEGGLNGYLNLGLGTGYGIIWGADLYLRFSDDEFGFGIYPAVGVKTGESVIGLVAGVDSSLSTLGGVKFLSEGIEAGAYLRYSNLLDVLLEFSGKNFEVFVEYSPQTGDLRLKSSFNLFGVVLGGSLSITDDLDYYAFGGITFAFGREKPESWYLKAILDRYTSKDYISAFELAKEGLGIYPTSEKLKNYFRMTRREFLVYNAFKNLDTGNYVDARKFASYLLKEYPNDLIALKRCDEISRKTLTDPRSYTDSGLEDDELQSFADAISYILAGDYDTAIEILSKLYISHRENPYVTVKLAEAFAMQGNWKSAEKLLRSVKDEVIWKSFVEGLVKFQKDKEAGREEFERAIKVGDIDHLRDSLFYLIVTNSRINPKKALDYGKLMKAIGYGRYEFEALYYLGIAAYRKGDLKNASDFLGEAIGTFESMPESEIAPEYRKMYERALSMIVDVYKELAKQNINYYLSAADYIARLIKITENEKKRSELIKEKAVMLYKGHDYENALYEFEAIVEKDKSVEKYYKASQARADFQRILVKIIQQGFPISFLKDDFRRVAEAYKRVFEMDPSILDEDDLVAMAYSGLISSDNDAYELALEKLESFSRDKAILMKAYRSFMDRNYEKAESYLRNVDERKLNDFFAALYYKILGRIAYESGDYKNAIKYLEIFFGKFKGVGMEGEDLVALSDSYMKIGNPEKALEVVSGERAGVSAGLYIIRAQALLKVGKYDEAFKTLRDLAESPMMDELSKDLKFEVYKIMGDLSFEFANFTSASDYFRAAEGYGELDKKSKARLLMSDLLIKKIKGERLTESELSVFIESEDDFVKVFAMIELSEKMLEEGRILKRIFEVETDEELLRGLLKHEIGKIDVLKGDFKKAYEDFVEAWKILRDRKILRKALICGLIAGEKISREFGKFSTDPLIADIVLLAEGLEKRDPSIFTRKRGFLQYYFVSKLAGIIDDNLEKAYQIYKKNVDGYGRAFLMFIEGILEGDSRIEGFLDMDDPIAELSRSKTVGTITEINPDFFIIKIGEKLKWKYEKRVRKYEVYELTEDGRKKIQSGRRNYVKFEEEGFRVLKIVAIGSNAKDSPPPMVIRVTENMPPVFKKLSPKSGEKTYKRFALSWDASDPEGDSIEYSIVYGKELSDLKLLKVGSKQYMRMITETGNIFWFVVAMDSAGNVSFSPIEMIDVTNEVHLKVLKDETLGTIEGVFASKDGKIFYGSPYSKIVYVLDTNGNIIASKDLSLSFKIHVIGKTVLIVDRSGKLLALNEKLEKIWEDPNNVVSNVAGKNDRIYYAIEGRLIARDETGRELWAFPKEMFAQVDVVSVLAFKDEIIALTKSKGYWLIYLSSDGEHLLSLKISSAGSKGRIMAAFGETVVVSVDDNVFFLREGRIVKRMRFQGVKYVLESSRYIILASDTIPSKMVALSKDSLVEIWRRDLYYMVQGMVIGDSDEIYIIHSGGIEVFDESGEIIGKMPWKLRTYYTPGDVGMTEDGRILFAKGRNLLIIEGASFRCPEYWNQPGGDPGRSYGR